MPINNIKNSWVVAMKINSINPNTEVFKNKEIQKKSFLQAPQAEKVRATQDYLKISLNAAIEEAKTKASNLPEVREEKVSKIKEQIQRGTYNVSNQQIARAMIGSLLSEIA